MAVSRRLRFEILKRDSHLCRYCGAKAPDVPLTVDHVVPVALGGSDDPTNLVTACKDCNSGKSSTSPDAPVVADVDLTAKRYAAAIVRVGQARRLEREALTKLVDAVFDEFAGHGLTTRDIDLAAEETLARFVEAGLEWDDLKYYVRVTAGAYGIGNVWRYFCGCCWTEIRRRQDLALNLIEDEGE